jgi:AraC-like DNA-binding protein
MLNAAERSCVQDAEADMEGESIIRKLNPRVERHVELPGMYFLLQGEKKVSGLIDITIKASEYHILSLNLAPLPELRNCYFPNAPASPVGVLSLRPAGIPVRIITRLENYQVVIFAVTPEKYKELSGSDDQWELQRTTDILGTPMIAMMIRIAQELATPGFRSERLLLLLAQSLAIDMARFARSCSSASGSEASLIQGGLSPLQLRKIADYAENLWGKVATTSDIADLLEISPRHLSRLFKIATGRTIHDYLAEMRLRRAISLLTNTDLSLKEISHRLGHSRHSGFTSAFRAATGKTPSEFRRNFGINA